MPKHHVSSTDFAGTFTIDQCPLMVHIHVSADTCALTGSFTGLAEPPLRSLAAAACQRLRCAT